MAGASPQYQQQSPWQVQDQQAYNPHIIGHGQPQGYQGAYQQPGHPHQGRQTGPPGPQTCYNCGSPDHWAQHCPEPRRAVPAGSVNRPNNPRPNKRHKSNGPIVTKYPVPPHVTVQHPSPQGYGATSYNKPGLPQQQSPYAPPTPLSAYPQSHHQWPHQQQYPHKGAYPQGQHYPQYGPQAPPTPATPYASHYPSPLSAQGPPKYNSFPTHSGVHQQNGPPQGNEPIHFTHIPPAPIPPTQQHWPQQSPQHVANYDRRISWDFNDGTQTGLEKSRQTSEVPADNSGLESDDLEGLDIPDIRNGQRAIGWHPPKLTTRPLASDYFAEEVIATLPPPPRGDGSSVSKYFTSANFQNSIRSVRDTSDWAAVKDDPVFQTIPENGDSIPTETLTAHRNLTNHNREHLNLNAEEGELGQERETESSHNNERDSHGWSVMNNLEQALNSGDFSAAAKKRHTASTAYSHEEKPQLRQHIEENDEGASARTAEEKLAALGVTGLPKPVRAPARPWPPPELGSESHPGVGDQGSRSRSRSPDFHDSISGAGRRASHGSPASITPYRERDPPSPRNGSHNGRQLASPEQRYGDGNLFGNHEQSAPTDRTRSQQTFDPPPRRGKTSKHDGANASPPSSESSHGHTHAPRNARPGPFNGYVRHGSNGYSGSPPTLRPERSNPRKREFDHRESSEEREHERRRQADDVTPKLKRRQPKVAEAYSRRW